MDRFVSFDDRAGTVTCEAGLLLSDLIDVVLPRGWFPPVTPGTRFVTIGGMIASDVHGKNHHGSGSFCDHVLSLDLMIGDRVLTCSATENGDFFAATCGGMGLTGVILRATFRLLAVETAAMRQRTLRLQTLEQAIDAIEASLESTYSVAWVDCLASGGNLGRSVLFLAEHAQVNDLSREHQAQPFARRRGRRRRVPIDFPTFALSELPVRLFNKAYYAAQRPGDALVDIDTYFYPLDSILEWNRIYGRRGFVQFQCGLPLAESRSGLRRLLEQIAQGRDASFLTVLKRMGAQSFGLLSFPFEGYSLALDFRATPENLLLIDRLDAITAEHGGRIYLAKDARTNAASLAAGYPRLDEFRAVRQRYGLDRRFTSLQSRRLEI